MSASPSFSPRVVAALGGLMAILFAASLLLSGRGGHAEGDSAGANSYSRSAVGYSALYEYLKASGLDVARARGDVLTKLGTNGVLVLAEPLEVLSGEDILLEERTAKTILLILPKWAGERDRAHAGWIASASLLPISAPRSALYGFDTQPEIVRAPAPAKFEVDASSLSPSISGTVQLTHSAKLKPLLATKDGILLGEIREAQHRIVVLADPDALENQGIGKADNATFARRLFDQLGDAESRYLFDETIHGFQGDSPAEETGGARSPELASLLLRFPLNLTLALAIVGLALLGGATIGRFGAPQTPPRPLGQGKRGLIANIASLIDYGGHHGELLKAYVEAVVRDVAQLLKAPPNLGSRDLGIWLDRLGQARGVKSSCVEILDAAAAAGKRDLSSLLGAAQAIHRWKEEIARGAS